MTYYYEEVARSRRRAFGAGILVGALVIALISGVLWVLRSGGAEEPAAPAQPAAQLDKPLATAEPPPTRLERCAEVFAAQTPLLETLVRPLSQWRTEIGVMNKVVTGVMTVDEGLGFWDQRRGRVLKALARYKSAHAVFDERTARCPGPGVGDPTPLELRCSQTVASRDAAVGAADTAMQSWEQHVRDMEMLRRGELTGDEAIQRWLPSWREDVAELATYRDAARAAEGQPC